MRKPLLPRDTSLGAIVLAAGGSRRLGRPKQLLRLRTQPLLVRVTRMAQQVCNGPVTVVLGADHLKLRSLLGRLETRPLIAYNANWRQGMAGSLKAGLAQLPNSTTGVLLLLVDQPMIGPGDLTRLIDAWKVTPARPAASVYAGQPGAPAILPRRYFAALRSLAGDTGARGLLRRLDPITEVEMPRAAFDVDTPADALRLAALGPALTTNENGES